MPALNALAAKAFDENTTFADRVHFVHVYTMEAHPMTPDPVPYYGAVAENDLSIVGQPRSYDARCSNASLMLPELDPSQLLLVDALGKQVNPVWCTYGPSPNSAFLIGQDGIVEVSQLWAQIGRMESSIRRMWAEAD